MSEFKFSQVDDPTNFNTRPGTVICETCCDQGVLQAVEGGCIIFHCPEHMTLCIKDGEVIATQSHGVRQ